MKGLSPTMWMNALKKLLQTNSENETEETPGTPPSSEPEQQPWQNYQPWGGAPGFMPNMAAPDIDQNNSQRDNSSVQQGGNSTQPNKKSGRKTPLSALFHRRNSAKSKTNVRTPNARTPMMNPRPGINRPGQFTPPYGQPWSEGHPGRMAQPGMRPPQRMVVDEWGNPVQRRNLAVPPNAFRLPPQPGMMRRPGVRRLPMGSNMVPGIPRRQPVRQFQEPWF